MKYKISVNVPTNNLGNPELPEKIIDAMAQAGAGEIENYSRVAYVSFGYETWRKNRGKIEKDDSVKIEMQCSQENLTHIIQAIKKMHPYEVPVIEIIELEEYN